MVRFVNNFVKITGWPVQKILFNTKVYYEDKEVQNRKIKGPAIIVSNHTSIFDYAVFLFVFYSRTLRYQMAEVLYRIRILAFFLKIMGGIKVDRNAHNFNFISETEKILKKNGVVGIFPESRLALKDEERPLPFKPSAAYIALLTNVPVIPVYTNGSYFHPFSFKKRAKVIIGKPISIADYTLDTLDEKANIERATVLMREKIIELGKLLNERD